MKRFLKYGLLAVVIGAGLGVAAQADDVATGGGITVRSADGNFEASLGGRIHFDGAILAPDNGSALGISGKSNDSGFFFRRVYITLKGKAYGFEYHVDEDVNDSNSPGDGLKNVWLAHRLFGGKIYIGQHKPWRSIDELASNNDTPFLERDALSANGLFGGRDYTQGLYYDRAKRSLLRNGDRLWLGGSFYTNAKAGQKAPGPSRAYGANARLVYAPILTSSAWLHLGASYSFDHFAADGRGFGLTSGYSTWYAKHGEKANLLSLSAAGVTRNASTTTLELMGALGPVFVATELGDEHAYGGAQSATVQAFSVNAAYALTGETRTYKKGDATYGGIKPRHSYGAVELAARYDYVRNKDVAS
ncbi:MAG: hypothetical protein KGJ55_11450, partial [Gammaproteobacteria bacterium]|nr:hypothetical protein [Gammaproteobacteria bacterium]